MGFLIRFAVTFVAVLVATNVPGLIVYRDLGTVALFSLVLALANALVRPVIVFLTCPIIIVTLGLALLLINAGLFLLADLLVEGVEATGLPQALLASLIVSVVGWGMSLAIRR